MKWFILLLFCGGILMSGCNEDIVPITRNVYTNSTTINNVTYNDSWIQPVIDLKVDIVNGSMVGLSNISGLYSCQNISGAVIQTVNYSRALEFCS